MEALYQQTRRILADIEENFKKLPPFNVNSVDSIGMENEIKIQITQVYANCERLDVMVHRLSSSHRQMVRMRIDQLKYDVRHFQNSLQQYQEKQIRYEKELMKREQLLSHRFTANNPETCIDFTYDHQNNLIPPMGNAHKGVDEMLDTGNHIMDSLLQQRNTLKGAHRRLITIGSTLGLSNHTMKLIGRRLTEDKYIMYGGMFLTIIIILVVMYFFVL